jgi:ABC-type multidrug transport system ATPase subunit
LTAPVRPVPETTVRVRGLVKRYKDGTVANRGIDLDVFRGDIVAILGPNGAGKTTFLRQVTTELRPTCGVIAVFNVDVVRHPQRAKRLMGIAPQEAGLFESLTVLQHLELFARLKGMSKQEAIKAAADMAGELGLDGQLHKRVAALSGGQRRRILIGVALLGRPPLLVLDEPTTGLDPASRVAVWGVLRRAAANGASIMFSTHYIEEAERLSDRVAIINAGTVIACGTSGELIARVKDSYRLSYHDASDPARPLRVCRYGTFAEASAAIDLQNLSEYSLARASLEDAYFELAGHPFPLHESTEAWR